MRTILAAALTLSGLVTLTGASTATAAGWTVRICRDATEASAINVWVATSEGAEKAAPTLAWKSDDKGMDVPVAGAAATADTIWVQAESVPVGGKFVLCALHDGKVAMTINGTTAAAVQVAKTASDASCPCAK